MAESSFVKINWQNQQIQIEYQWLNREKTEAPLFVFLHEGLGSVAMWRDYPQQLCESLKVRGLMYSRPGYGRSSPSGVEKVWAKDFMHRQAFEVLPALFTELAIDEKPWLFGHSDGGSIALLHASRYPVSGLIVLAPHIMVEDVCLHSIENAREAFVNTNLRDRLSRYHDDVDSAFWSWNEIWLNPSFRNWSIEADIRAITCPVLAIQGENDEYGTMAQIRGIAQKLPPSQTQLLEIANCAHSPHRDQPELLNKICLDFFDSHNQNK